MTDTRDLADRLAAVLANAQADRYRRNELVDDGAGGSICAWVLHERQVMLDEVNRLRSLRELPPVAVAAVERKESLACGHVDYSRKFAFYCAELATEGGGVS